MSENTKRIVYLDGEKPLELMTEEELNEHYLKHFNMTYDEFIEYYKDDTEEKIMTDLRALFQKTAV